MPPAILSPNNQQAIAMSAQGQFNQSAQLGVISQSHIAQHPQYISSNGTSGLFGINTEYVFPFTLDRYILLKNYSQKERVAFLTGFIEHQIISNRENYITKTLATLEEYMKKDHNSEFNNKLNEELFKNE